jgi:hypothetical protein
LLEFVKLTEAQVEATLTAELEELVQVALE